MLGTAVSNPTWGG